MDKTFYDLKVGDAFHDGYSHEVIDGRLVWIIYRKLSNSHAVEIHRKKVRNFPSGLKVFYVHI